MSKAQHDLSRLAAFGHVLIPGDGKMPSASSIVGYHALLQRAIKASALTEAEIGAMLDAIPGKIDWDAAKAFSASNPAKFEIAATIASGAYLLAPEVLSCLGFPMERRFPAGPMDFAEEYETGVVDEVVSRGQRWVDPRGR